MAFDTYISLTNDIKGESLALKDGIEIFSFSWGASSPVSVGTGTQGLSASKVSISSFNIMKRTDAASAKLFLRCCTGDPIDTATVHMRKQTGAGGQADFLTLVFTHVMVESFQQSGSSGGDDTPTESVSLAFQKVHITYHKTGEKNQLTVGGEATWDITSAKNK